MPLLIVVFVVFVVGYAVGANDKGAKKEEDG